MSNDKAFLRRPLGDVVVATDFSPSADLALGRAAQLPIGRGSTLALLHVTPTRLAATDALLQKVAAVERMERSRGQTLLQAEGSRREPVDVVPEIVEGKPFVEIVRNARNRRAELIVLGRRGEGGFRALLVGSTAERVIRKAGASVLVVTRPAAGPYQRPLVAIDFSDSSRLALETTLRLVGPDTGVVELLHAYDVPPGTTDPATLARHLEAVARANFEKFLVDFASAGVEWRITLKEGDARQVIPDLAAERQCDLVALGSHGRSGFAQILIGSVAEAVVRGAPCDVLVARQAAAEFKLP